jgi:hypothetical protein
MEPTKQLTYFAVRIPQSAKLTLRKLKRSGKIIDMSTFARDVLVEKLKELDCDEGRA